MSQTQLASFIKTAELLQIRGLSSDGDTEGSQAPPSARRQDRSVAASPPPTPPPRSRSPPPGGGSSGDLPAGGQPPTKRRRDSGGPARGASASVSANPTGSTNNNTAQAGSTSATTSSTASSASAVEPDTANAPKRGKTEPVDLSEDDAAALEEALACLSSYEDHSSPSPHVLDSPGGPQQPEARHRDSAGVQLAGLSAGPSFIGAATRQRSAKEARKSDERHGNESPSRTYTSPSTNRLPRSRRGNCIKEPKLNVSILPQAILKRMTLQLPLDKKDWRTINDCIYAEFKHADVSAHGWYSKLAISLATQFPYLYEECGVHEFIDMTRIKLQNKFRNSRRSEGLKRKRRRFWPKTRAAASVATVTLKELEPVSRDQEPAENIREEVLSDPGLGGTLVQFVGGETPELSEMRALTEDGSAPSDPLELHSAKRSERTAGGESSEESDASPGRLYVNI